MVQIDVVRSSNSSLVQSHPLVAIFVGGTSGIGEYTVKALATHAKQGQGLRLYIVGRNSDAAEMTISDCTRLCPEGDFRFVKAGDLALLKDVDLVCAEIMRMEEESVEGRPARVDLLVLTQAYFSFDARKDTNEGLGSSMSLLYYSRMRFIMKLLPLLLASPLPAHVISVFAAGLEGNFFPTDLSLRDPKHYSFANLRSHVTYMTTFFLETLTERHPGRLSLVHVFPGVVMTKAFNNSGLPRWFKLAWRVFSPVVRLFSVPADECGERMLFLATPRFPAREETGEEGTAECGQTTTSAEHVEIAIGTSGRRGSGAYAVNSDGETIPTKKTYAKIREEGMKVKTWDHTMKAFEEIEAGRVFTG